MEQAAVPYSSPEKPSTMFGKTKAFSSFSVNDMQQAKEFYQQKLGLEVEEIPDMGPLLTLKIAGGGTIMLYEKKDHAPASFTVLNFPVDNVDEAVDKLTALGIKFLHYKGSINTDEKGISRGEGPVIAWFTDPAGNIMSVVENNP